MKFIKDLNTKCAADVLQRPSLSISSTYKGCACFQRAKNFDYRRVENSTSWKYILNSIFMKDLFIL